MPDPTKKTWLDNLPTDVYSRLCACHSLKSDIVPLTQARWASIKERPGLTKEDALVDVLDLLDSNSQYCDLTREEYDNILAQIY